FDRGFLKTRHPRTRMRTKQECFGIPVKLFHLAAKDLDRTRDDDVPRKPLARSLATLRGLRRNADAHHHARTTLDLEQSGCVDAFVRDDRTALPLDRKHFAGS